MERTKGMFALVLLLAGCASAPDRPGVLSASLAPPPVDCDTSVRTIDLRTRMRNQGGADLGFRLMGDRGPPYALWYMGYRVYEAAPGEPFVLVHDSPQHSTWTRTLAIAPGDAADFHTPLFGLRPRDYRRWFRIELRDSQNRSHWTGVFALCAVQAARCGCPGAAVDGTLGGIAAAGESAACPTASPADRCR